LFSNLKRGGKIIRNFNEKIITLTKVSDARHA